MKKIKTIQESLEEIKFLMEYDSSKTRTENKLLVTEQWNWGPQVQQQNPNAQPIQTNPNVNPDYSKSYDPYYKSPDPNIPNGNPTVIQIPPQLKNIDGVKAFQNWLDQNYRGWIKKYNVLGGDINKGFGKFGPNTLRAWNQYGKVYLSSAGYTPPSLTAMQGKTSPTPISSNPTVPASQNNAQQLATR